METHGVALGYWGDKIRYIAIRVRFTTEFFFEHGFYRIDADASLLEVLSSILNKVIGNR